MESGASCRRIIPDLARDHKHRNRIHVTAGHACHSVNSPWPGGNADSGNLIINSGITLRRHGTGLFMVIIHAVKSLLMPQSIIQMHRPSAGD